MDMGSIAAAFSSLNAVAAITKGLVGLHATAEVQAKAIELNQQIIEAQSALFSVNQMLTALVERVRELEGQIARMKDWDAEKQRYKLVAPYPGCMVYALQKSMSNGEPPHYLCTSCFQKGEPSILQGREGKPRKEGGRVTSSYLCSTCGTEAFTEWGDVPVPKYSDDIMHP